MEFAPTLIDSIPSSWVVLAGRSHLATRLATPNAE